MLPVRLLQFVRVRIRSSPQWLLYFSYLLCCGPAQLRMHKLLQGAPVPPTSSHTGILFIKSTFFMRSWAEMRARSSDRLYGLHTKSLEPELRPITMFSSSVLADTCGPKSSGMTDI